MILTVEYISGDLSMIQGHFQGQKFRLKIKFAQIQIDTSVIPLFGVVSTGEYVYFDWRIISEIILMI